MVGEKPITTARFARRAGTELSCLRSVKRGILQDCFGVSAVSLSAKPCIFSSSSSSSNIG